MTNLYITDEATVKNCYICCMNSLKLVDLVEKYKHKWAINVILKSNIFLITIKQLKTFNDKVPLNMIKKGKMRFSIFLKCSIEMLA